MPTTLVHHLCTRLMHTTMHTTLVHNSCIQLLCTTHAYNLCIQLMHTTMHTTHAYYSCAQLLLYILPEVMKLDQMILMNCFLLISEEIAFYQGNKKEQSIIYSS